ncbi:hypothetical protein MC885_010651 [Smutsia gigantea]|nr:hypothetical protein MC885_010651 [Smutsia gigantea]
MCGAEKSAALQTSQPSPPPPQGPRGKPGRLRGAKGSGRADTNRPHAPRPCWGSNAAILATKQKTHKESSHPTSDLGTPWEGGWRRTGVCALPSPRRTIAAASTRSGGPARHKDRRGPRHHVTLAGSALSRPAAGRSWPSHHLAAGEQVWASWDPTRNRKWRRRRHSGWALTEGVRPEEEPAVTSSHCGRHYPPADHSGCPAPPPPQRAACTPAPDPQ